MCVLMYVYCVCACVCVFVCASMRVCVYRCDCLLRWDKLHSLVQSHLALRKIWSPGVVCHCHFQNIRFSDQSFPQSTLFEITVLAIPISEMRTHSELQFLLVSCSFFTRILQFAWTTCMCVCVCVCVCVCACVCVCVVLRYIGGLTHHWQANL